MSRENRIWFDTEFIDDGKTVEMISIGMINSKGQTYYAEPIETDRSRACEWVQQNVIPGLLDGSYLKPRDQIRDEIVKFAGGDPEFWAYYAPYDWLCLCQLFGRMIDVPRGWPQFPLDLQQLLYLNNLYVFVKDVAHNALQDAIWTKQVHNALELQSRDLLPINTSLIKMSHDHLN